MADITIPRNDSLIETDENSPTRKDPFIASRAWLEMFFDPLATLLTSVVKVLKATASPTTQGAAIPTSSAFLTTQSGVYRVNYVLRVTRPATVSSALQITIGWERSGIAETKVGVNLVGNTTTTYESDTFPVKADGLTDLTYSVAYTSVGATPMLFEVDVIVEKIG